MIEMLVDAIRELGVPALLGVVVMRLLDERSWRRRVSFERQVARYERLMATFSAFYQAKDDITEDAGTAKEHTKGARTKDAQDAFLAEYRCAWLYADDAVLDAGNRFLKSVSDQASDAERASKEEAARQFVIAMRRELRGATRLKPDDFQFWSAAD